MKTGKKLKLDGVETVTARNSLWMSEAMAAFRKFIRNRPLFTGKPEKPRPSGRGGIGRHAQPAM